MRLCLWLLAIATPIALSFNTLASEKAVLPLTMIPIKVSPHAYYVQGGTGIATDNYGFVSNSAFVVTAEGVIVFDALGTPSLANRLLEKIREITEQPVVRVIVSHYHADHIYGLQVFEELGAKIYAAPGANEYRF